MKNRKKQLYKNCLPLTLKTIWKYILIASLITISILAIGNIYFEKVNTKLREQKIIVRLTQQINTQVSSSDTASNGEKNILTDTQNINKQNKMFEEQPLVKIVSIQKTAVMKREDQSYGIKLSPRVNLQQPKLSPYKLRYSKIQKKNQNIKDNAQQNCLLINSANILTKLTIRNALKILKFKSFHVAYIITDVNDEYSEDLIFQGFSNYQIQRARIDFTSDFHFNTQLKNSCDKVVYMFGNFKITQQMAKNIKSQVAQIPSEQLYFTSNVMKKDEIVTLPNLIQVDLQRIEPIQFCSYLYIFDTKYLHLTTPINFVYYAKYTIQEIILLPILVIYQTAQRITTSYSILHGYDIQLRQFKQFAIQPLKKEDNALCFISYPNNLYQIDSQNAIQYIKSIQYQQYLQDIANITVIVYLPYRFNQTKQIWGVLSYLAKFKQHKKVIRLKLRILNDKISPGYAIYDSVHAYCPSKSFIVSSRHNVRFSFQMVKQLISSISQKYHYYFFNFYSSFNFIHKQFSQHANMTIPEHKFMHIQTFKSDLFKMVSLWILKNAEIDFYQTQLPFIRNMLQTMNYTYYQIKKSLATVQDRNLSLNQLQQISFTKQYTPYFALKDTQLVPYQYNSLHNSALRRNAPQKISRLIHQIWLGKGQINKLRLTLHNSVIKTNQNFNVKLWTFDDISQKNFPNTYQFIRMVLQKHKQWYRSLYAMVSSLMRYQIILQNGGIYLDFRFEARKPLDNFLKYQIFFIDIDISTTRFGSPKTLGNGAMGATKNNYHLKIVLSQLILQKTYTFVDYDLPWVTGAFVLRKSATDYEIFTQISFGFYLFIATPYQSAENFCGGVNRVYDEDQQVFTIKYSLSQKDMTIGFPCKKYPQSYLVIYSPLGSTWVREKSKVD